jgi:hypothetical protein
VLSIVSVILSIIVIIPSINTDRDSIITVTSNSNLADAKEKHIVPTDQIVSGGPPPDGIPSIDNPKFISVQRLLIINI